MEGKILHTKVTLHLSECVLSKTDAESWSSCIFNPLLIAERVSDTNTGKDIGEWMKEIVQDSQDVSLDHYKIRITPIPILMKFDCALELLAGSIIAFRSNGCQVNSSPMYSNIMMYLLLQHEKTLLNDESSSSSSVKRAKTSVERIIKHCIHCILIHRTTTLAVGLKDARIG